MTVVAVVNRSRGERITLEAAHRADDLDTDLHIVYVLGLNWFSTLELSLAERIGIPVGMDIVRDRCADIAGAIAASVAEQYEAVGLVGDPDEEVAAYARQVGADCIVIDGRRSRSKGGIVRTRGSWETVRGSDIPVIPVH